MKYTKRKTAKLNDTGCWYLRVALNDLPRMVPAFWSEFERNFLNDFLWEIISLKQLDGGASYEWLELVISLDTQAGRAKKMLREYEN